MQKAPLLGSDGSPLDALPHLGRCSITYLNGMCGTFLLMAVWFAAYPKNSTARSQMIPQAQLEVLRQSVFMVQSLPISCNSNFFHHSHPGLAEASPRCVANYRNPYYEQARLWVRWQVLAFRNVAASHSNYGLFSAFILQTQRAFMPHSLHASRAS